MQRRLYFIFVAIFLVVLLGSTGYYIIFGGEPKFLDCVYMTVISLTSVGYGEILEVTGHWAAQVFTMFLITFGMGIILYGISTMTAMIVEGEVSGILRKKAMAKQISRLSNHYIVCGGGQTGRYVIEELFKNKEQIVLIEQDSERIELCTAERGIPYIQGDATDDANLVNAGIDKAVGIVITLHSDKDTIYVTMSARMLNPKIRISSRMVDPKIEPKLRKAGADSVVSPNFIGGLRMASEMIRPAAVSFLDNMLRSTGAVLRIHELTISAGSRLLGKTVETSGIGKKFGLMVLGGKKRKASEMTFNPPPSMPLAEGTILVVMGESENIARARALASSSAGILQKHHAGRIVSPND